MNEAIDWKKKLTSRKFWAAICALVTNIIAVFGGSESEAVKVTALIMAGATVIAYIVGEGLVDASASKGDQYCFVSGEPPEDEAEKAEEPKPEEE